VLARRGRTEEAEALAREAWALIERVDSPSTVANSLLDLAEVLALGGKPDQAVPLVQQAGLLHEKKGNLVTAERARTVLEHLAEPSPGAMALP
jgi:Flp pilus assembly protein TadD